MKIVNKLLAIVAAVGMTSAAQAAPLVIDHFLETQSLEVGAGVSASSTVSGSMLGGFRTVTADATTNSAGGNSLEVKIGGDSFTGDSMEVSNGVGIAGTVTVLWDANGAGLGGFDLTDGGAYNYITVDVLSIDLSTNVSFTLVDTLLQSWTVGPSAFGGPGAFNVLISEFSDNGVDVTSLASVSMVVSGPDSWDGVFDLVEANDVPTPAPIALLGLGLAGIGLLRRKIA